MNKDIPTFDSATRDLCYWKGLDEIFDKEGYGTEAILRNWQAYVMRRDLPRFLAHYELFKQVIDLPGCIVELGVFKGASFFTWSKLLETFCSFDRTRKVFGFDHFEGLGNFDEKDGATDEVNFKNEGGWKATAEEVRMLVKLHNSDNMIPNTSRAILIEGDVCDTLPKFLDENPGLKISLLHFDMDLYKPTKLAMELLYPLVVTGGIICFDEYGLMPWQGETKAVDEYFSSFDKKPIIRKHHFSHLPHGFLVKE